MKNALPMPTVNETNSQTPPDDALNLALGRWKKTVEAELKGASFEKKLVTTTFDGVALQPLYTRADLAGIPDLAIGPGETPFLRGARAKGYKARAWEFAQEISARSAVEFNAAMKIALLQGQDAVVLSPAGNGSNSAEGVSITSLADLRSALADIDLAAVSLHLNAGCDALPFAALYLTVADDQGISRDRLKGSLTADPLGEWAKSGQLAHGIGTLYDALADWTAWSAQHTPGLQTIGVDGRMWGDAGCNAVQELAFSLAMAADYLRALTERGVSCDVAGARMRFQFAIGPQFFTEIAKFRAWRPLWTRVLSGFGASEDVAAHGFVHAATARWNQSLLDPHVNMLRVTTEALSAVLGSCDSLHISPFDEVTGNTDEFSQRIARNVHTLLAEEFSFTQTADPAGGSWYIEKLTDELARKAWSLFQKIEGRGGFTAALREGFVQQLVATAQSEKAEAVGKRRLSLIGTNIFPNLRESVPVRRESTARPAAVTPASQSPAQSSGPVTATWPERLGATVAAAKAGANLSELARLSASRAQPDWAVPPIRPWRASAGFEALRAASAEFAKRTGKRPCVFLAKIGPALQHKARADFSAGFFATAGFEVLAKQSFESPEKAAESAVASGALLTVLCSTDETYPALVPAFASQVKAAAPNITVVLAGLPSDQGVVAAYRAAGVDDFIHVRANAQELLAKFLKQIGALA